jgi:hypothetical protein
MSTPSVKNPNLAASNERDLNAFYANQGVVARLLAHLSYPIHRFVAADLARSQNKDVGVYDAAEFTKEFLQKARPRTQERNRTGSFLQFNNKVDVPLLEKGPLQQLLLMTFEVDQRRKAGYEKAVKAFVAAYLRTYSYSISLAIRRHISATPVRSECPIQAAEQRRTVAELKRLFDENEILVERLLQANHGLVSEYANRLAFALHGNFSRMMNDGRTGLCDGIFRYTPDFQQKDGSVGSKTGLGGVAAAWIQHHIRRSHQYNNRTISIPITAQELRADVLKIQDGDPKKSVQHITEEFVLTQRAEADPSFAERLKADRVGLIEELRTDEGWLEEVARTTVRISDAVFQPKSRSLDFENEFAVKTLEDDLRKEGINVSISSGGTLEEIELKELNEKVDEAVGSLPAQKRLMLVYSFALPTAKKTGRKFLEDIIGTSTRATAKLRQGVKGRRPAKISLLDGVKGPEAEDEAD